MDPPSASSGGRLLLPCLVCIPEWLPLAVSVVCDVLRGEVTSPTPNPPPFSTWLGTGLGGVISTTRTKNDWNHWWVFKVGLTNKNSVLWYMPEPCIMLIIITVILFSGETICLSVEIQICIGVASYGALGHVTPSTSSCFNFLVTSEPHKLRQWTPCGCLIPTQKEYTWATAFSLFIAWMS